jgi:hypothetical protein
MSRLPNKREMVEGPTAFENFKRLMSRLLVAPKKEIAEPAAAGRKQKPGKG